MAELVGGRQLVTGVAVLVLFGFLGLAAELALESVSGRDASVWAKLPISLAFLWLFIGFLWWAHRAASRRPLFPSHNDVIEAPATLLHLFASLKALLAHAATVLDEELRHRGIGKSGTLLYVNGSRFWATIAVLLILSALTGITQYLLERSSLGILGNLLPFALLLVYLEWIHLCAIGNFRPLYTTHFDERNLLVTHPPDRREIPASAFDPPTPKAAEPSSSADSGPTESEVFGKPEQLSKEWKTACITDPSPTETDERRRQREEFERRRDTHYDMGQVFKKINLDDIKDDESSTKTQPEGEGVPATREDSSEWMTMTPDDVKAAENAKNSPEGLRKQTEFEKKRAAFDAVGMQQIKGPVPEEEEKEEEVPKKQSGTATEIQFGTPPEEGEPERKTGGGSPSSGDKKEGEKHPTFVEPVPPARAKGHLSHSEFVSKREAMEAELGRVHKSEVERERRDLEKRRELAPSGTWTDEEVGGTTTEEERDLLISAHELLSQHFLMTLGEETLMPDSGSPLLLLRYLKHQIRMAAATADVLEEEIAFRENCASPSFPSLPSSSTSISPSLFKSKPS